jgi:hypothetical protein
MDMVRLDLRQHFMISFVMYRVHIDHKSIFYRLSSIFINQTTFNIFPLKYFSTTFFTPSSPLHLPSFLFRSFLSPFFSFLLSSFLSSFFSFLLSSFLFRSFFSFLLSSFLFRSFFSSFLHLQYK